MSEEQITLPVGATVQDIYGDNYCVEGLLGKGGFGAVYLVRDRHNKDHVFALKEVIDPSVEERKRLLFECEVLKRLEHKALPHVYHVFENEKLKRVYLLMEYIKGKNLSDLRKKQPKERFPSDVALAIMTPIVDALIYMHQQEPPVVHRDMKPSNIIVPLDGGEAVLVDFGTAKEYFSEGTTMAFRHGSPGFVAIEQYGKRSGTDMRTDVYGLGATLYVLLTGVTPVDAISRVMGDQEGDTLKPVSELVPDISLSVNNAIMRAMSVHKKDRFESIEAFWHALHTDPADPTKQQEQKPQLQLPETPLPPTLFDADIESDVPAFEPNKQWEAPLEKRRVLLLLLTTTVLLTLGAILFSSFVRPAFYRASSVAPTVTKSISTPVSKTPSSASATSISAAVLYPLLASSYAGTINDISVAHAKTNMYLRDVQQNQGLIRGSFQGLGLVGSFTGTVSTSEELHFTVNISSNNTMLVFDGTIKVGGDVEGNFKVVNQNGQSTGEYGLWYVSATT